MYYQIEVKQGCKWIAVHAPITNKMVAYRTAIRLYGAEFWKQFLGGTRTVRVTVRQAPYFSNGSLVS